MTLKEKMKAHFFNTIRMYMLVDSVWNRYDDVILYWSYDTEQFLKRHELNNKPIGNWIQIPHNKYEMFYLKKNLLLKDKDHLSMIQGRMIDTMYVKDDLWKKFMNYIDDTFKNFLLIYDDKNKKRHAAKKLF